MSRIHREIVDFEFHVVFVNLAKVLNILRIVSSIGRSIGTGWISQQDKILCNCFCLVLYSFARR